MNLRGKRHGWREEEENNLNIVHIYMNFKK